jgi:murein tripeptide amidase MpaA
MPACLTRRGAALTTTQRTAGEAMAEWFMEGLLERLTDPTDAVCRRLLQQSTLYLVPNMCPDGTW